MRLVRGVLFRASVDNLWDESYVNYLNVRNPFSGSPIPEPGRTWFARVSVVW